MAGWQTTNGDDPPLVATVAASPTVAPTRALSDIPGADIVDLPRYPGAVRVGYQQRAQSTLGLTRIDYVTSAELQLVHAYYRDVIDAHAWQVADIDFTTNERYFFLLSGEREATVTLTEQAAGADVTITLTEPLDVATPTTAPTPTPTSTPEPSPTPSATATPWPTPDPAPTAIPEPVAPVVPTEPPPPPAPEPPAPEPTPDDDDDDDDDDGGEDEDDDDDDG